MEEKKMEKKKEKKKKEKKEKSLQKVERKGSYGCSVCLYST